MLHDQSTQSLQTFMQQALEQAESRCGFCAPNPCVGAVVVKEGVVIATGVHWAYGYPHAEVVALEKVGSDAIGASLYVSLEPCCYYGKTPPCTDLIIKKGIKSVYYGLQDPNPQVAGKGVEILQQAGITCYQVAHENITAFYKSYTYWWQHHRPWVTAKLAMSLDGKIAGINGEPVQITGVECQRFTHERRKYSDAILTTINTILSDNPQLNVRLNNDLVAKPIYILDSQLRLPLNARVLETSLCLTVFHGYDAEQTKINALSNLQVNCVAVEKDESGLNLSQVLDFIGKQGIHNLWVEAGGYCFYTFFQQRLLQQAYFYIAPKYLGKRAQSAFPDIFNVFDSCGHVNWQMLGQDLVCELHGAGEVR